ncbi:crispr-associated protein Cas4 [Candidatus Magnetoovum chiemensis]|nr:crispr-associated protein Cas4 [Candidatus Magnetoovum chiemensis]
MDDLNNAQIETDADNIDDTETTPMITPSEVMEYLFCPRFTYFMNCLDIAQHEELRYKVVKGRVIHKKREDENRDYIRKRLGCVSKDVSIYLASRELGVRGIVDEVLELSDGTLSPLDYKYAEYNDFTYKTHKIQSCLYAMLIEYNYKRDVKRGYICYVRSKNTIKEIEYKEADFNYAKEAIKEIFDIILKGYFPKKTKWYNKCADCCYKNICV